MRALWIVVVAGCGFEVSPTGARIDASVEMPVDSWTASQCPASYTITGQTSRYRVDRTAGAVWNQSDRCQAEGPGIHLVALDDPDEVKAIQAELDATTGLPITPGFPGDVFVWVGGIQQLGEAEPTTGWVQVTGEKLIDSEWEAGEPNDFVTTDRKEDDEEQFASLWQGHSHLVDMRGLHTMGAICECDGKPMAPAVTAMYEAQR